MRQSVWVFQSGLERVQRCLAREAWYYIERLSIEGERPQIELVSEGRIEADFSRENIILPPKACGGGIRCYLNGIGE